MTPRHRAADSTDARPDLDDAFRASVEMGRPPSWIVEWGGAGEHPRRPPDARVDEGVLWVTPDNVPVGSGFARVYLDTWRPGERHDGPARVHDMRRWTGEGFERVDLEPLIARMQELVRDLAAVTVTSDVANDPDGTIPDYVTTEGVVTLVPRDVVRALRADLLRFRSGVFEHAEGEGLGKIITADAWPAAQAFIVATRGVGA